MKQHCLLFSAVLLLCAVGVQAGQLRPAAATPETRAPYATFLADTQPMDHTVSLGDVSFSYGHGKTPIATRVAEPATFFMRDRSDAGYSRYDLHLDADTRVSRTRYSLSYFEPSRRAPGKNEAGGALQLNVERHTDLLNLHSGVSFPSPRLEAAEPAAGPVLVNAGGATPKLGVNFVYLYAPDSMDNDAATGMRSLLSSAGAYSSALPLTILTLPGHGLLAEKNSQAADETAPTGLRAYGLSVGINLTDGFTLSGSLAYARTDRKKTGDAEGYGWEYNLGAAYRFRDNLSYKAHVGYFSPGEYFDAQDENGISRESIYMLSNAITMTF